MDIGKAIIYPARDWKRVFHLILSIIGIVTFPAFLGYNIAVIRKVAADEEDFLPEWDFGDNWIDGLKATIALFLYVIPIAIIASILGSGNSQSDANIVIALILGFPVMFMYFVGLMRFSIEERLGAFFELPKNFEILQRNFLDFIGTMLLIYAVNIIVGWISALLSITICLGFVTLSYAYLVNSYLIGKLSKRIKLTPPDEIVFQPPTPTHEIPSSTRSSRQTDSTESYQTAVTSSSISSLIHSLETATVYEIQVPKGEKLEPERAVAIIEQVVVGIFDLTFAIVAESGKISWQIWDLRQELNPMVIKQSITDVYPQAQVTVKSFEQTPFTEPFWRAVLLYQQGLDFVAPIKYISDCVKLDPLATLVNGMGDLREGERVMHFIHIPSPLSEKSYKDAFKRITRSTFNLQGSLTSWEGAGELVGSTLSQLANQGRTGKYDPAHQQIYEERLASHLLLNCYLLTQIDIPDYERMSKFVGIFKSMLQFRGEENFIVQSEELTPADIQVQNAQQDKTSSAMALLGKWIDGTDLRFKKAKLVLSTQEIAALWHLPHEAFTTKEIIWKSKASATDELLEIQDGICLGDTEIAGAKQSVYIHTEDRETHTYIIGRTGVGKSTFLHNLIHQDIQAGNGVAVLDPHGTLVRDILRLSIPPERENDVVVLDIASQEHPLPLNPLGSAGDDDTFTDEVIALLEKHEGELPGGVDDSLKAAFATVRHEATPTVRDIVRLFTDAEYRYKLSHLVDFVPAQEYWDNFETLTIGEQKQRAKPIFRRMRKFYGNSVLYPIFCHPDKLDFGELIKQKRILLISLGIDSRKVSPNLKALLGLVLVSQIQMAAMASYEQTDPFYFYIDEVQNYISAPLPLIFEEARKYGLHLTVANQYLRQLGRVVDSVMGNVGTSIVFQIGKKDSVQLKDFFEPEFEPAELANMDKYHAAVKTRYLGNTVSAFKLATRPEPNDLFDFDLKSDEAKEREAYLRQKSIENWTPKTRDQVLEWLKNRYPRQEHPSPQNVNQEDGVDWLVTDEGD